MTIRVTDYCDMELLVELRMAYLLDQNSPQSLGDIELLKETIRNYLDAAMKKDEFAAVVMEDGNTVVSCAFLSVVDRPPRRSGVSCGVGTVYNVFTYPQHRRKGYAKSVMQEILKLAETLNVGSLDLLASEDGKPLYENLGFQIPKHVFMRRKV